jgi:hypothetical protein
MTNLPTGQSSITATTAPGSNPLAQAAGAGLGAYTAYSLLKPRMKEGGLVSIKKFQVGGLNEITPPVKKKQEGVFSDEERFALLAAPVIGSLLQGTTAPGQSNLQSLFKSVGQGVSQIPDTAIAIKKLDIAGRKEGKERIIERALTPAQLAASNLPLDTIATTKYAITEAGEIPLGSFDIKVKSEVKELGDDIDKSKIAVFDSALKQTEDLFAKQYNAGAGLPGMGVGGTLAAPFSKQARINQDTFQGTLNKLIKQDAGTSQSLQEAQRLAQEFSQSSFRTEEEVVGAIKRMREKVEDEKKSIFAKYTNPETVKEYVTRGGVNFRESPFKTPGSADQEKVTLESGLNTYKFDPKSKTLLKLK